MVISYGGVVVYALAVAPVVVALALAGTDPAAEDQPKGDLLAGGFRWRVSQPLVAPLVRPDDVAADNTVESTYIADAKITYEGPMMEVMKRGLLDRLMDFLNIF